MNRSFVDSKQIDIVGYIEQTMELYVYFYSGDVLVYTNISTKEYQAFLDTANQYDYLVNMIQDKHRTEFHKK